MKLNHKDSETLYQSPTINRLMNVKICIYHFINTKILRQSSTTEFEIMFCNVVNISLYDFTGIWNQQ